MVKLLADNGAALNLQDKQGVTPLIWASHNGHKEVVKILLDQGAKVNTKMGGRIHCNTRSRAERGCGHCAIAHCQRCGSKRESYKWGDASFSGCDGGQSSVVRVLIDAGADVNAQANEGTTVLQIATQQGQNEVVKLLKSAGATN